MSPQTPQTMGIHTQHPISVHTDYTIHNNKIQLCISTTTQSVFYHARPDIGLPG